MLQRRKGPSFENAKWASVVHSENEQLCTRILYLGAHKLLYKYTVQVLEFA